MFDKRLRDPDKVAAARGRLRADVAGDGVPTADVIIEAIFESLEAKRALYASLEPRMKSTALLATNTSSLKLEPLAEQLVHPERLIGLHFFNPVSQMPLVEVVCGTSTSEESKELGVAFTRRLDKLPIVCRSAPGFVVNRVLMPYLHEAMLLAQEGVPLAAIDAAATDFGMPVGPIELADVVGLDVAKDVGRDHRRGAGETRPVKCAARRTRGGQKARGARPGPASIPGSTVIRPSHRLAQRPRRMPPTGCCWHWSMSRWRACVKAS